MMLNSAMMSSIGLLLLGAFVSPPLENGTYTFRTLPTQTLDGDGVPLTAPAFSIGIGEVRVGTLTIYGCTDVDPTRTYTAADPVLVSSVIPAPPIGSQRVKVNAWAFSLAGCQGEVSPPSEVWGAVFFGPPGRPDLLP
jgi:hypothetical protein